MSYWNRPFGYGASIVLLIMSGCASPYAYYGDGCCGGPGSFSGRYSDGGCDGCAECEPADCSSLEDHTLTGTLRQSATCGGGCGEVYYGEWSFDPPDECDPCGNHGDWIGPRCCPPHGLGLLCSGFLGQRFGSHGGECDCCECIGDCGATYESESSYYGDDNYELDFQQPGDGMFVPPAGLGPEAGPIPSVRQSIVADRSPAIPNQSNSARDPNSRLIRRPRR
jgi:hypothetical protein